MADDGGDGWITVIGTEFGEVDNPNYSGNSKASWDNTQWNVGSGGANLAGWDTVGVALPNVPLGTHVKLRNPDTGATTSATVVDSGPGESTGAGIDMLAGTRAALGYPVNYKGNVQYQIVGGTANTGTPPSSLSGQPTLFNQQNALVGGAPSGGGQSALVGGSDSFPSGSTAQQQQKPQQPQQQKKAPLPGMPQVGGYQTAQLDPALQQSAQGFAQRAAQSANPQTKVVDYSKSYDVLAKFFGEDQNGGSSGQQQQQSDT